MCSEGEFQFMACTASYLCVWRLPWLCDLPRNLSYWHDSSL